MDNLEISDNAGEVRVEILGRLAGGTVEELSRLWASVLKERSPRLFTVDITNLNGFDYIGCALLRDMQKHGVQIAAASAASLVYLAEISRPRSPGPTLVSKNAASAKPGKTRSSKSGQPRFAASGE